MSYNMRNKTSFKLFITGTDTDVGKTYISKGLLNAFNDAGLTTTACKPVASGCDPKQTVNADALALQRSCSVKLSYQAINPLVFTEAIAPHVAAARSGQTLDIDTLKNQCAPVLNYPADVCVIEGAGGWYTPLNAYETLADFAEQLHCYIILVIGMRLGCLNHSILTWQALRQARTPVCGWIANCIQPEMPALEENLASLHEYLPIPHLGIVRYNASVADSIALEKILRLFHNRCVAG